MVATRGNTYQAEILRHLHDKYEGHLQDTDIGVSRRIWNELGQTAGEHFASVAATLSNLESEGVLLTEFGLRAQGGRCRVSVLLIEEPPKGVTVHHGRAINTPVEDLPTDVAPPTAEQIAAWLLRKAVEAATVNPTDIIAAQHHVECLNEELAAWQELASSYEEQAQLLQRELAETSELLAIADEMSQLPTTAPVVVADERHVEEIANLRRDLTQQTRWKEQAVRDLATVREAKRQVDSKLVDLNQQIVDLQAALNNAMDQEEARQLRQKLYGTERSLADARKAIEKFEPKLQRTIEQRDQALADLSIERSKVLDLANQIRAERREYDAYVGDTEKLLEYERADRDRALHNMSMTMEVLVHVLYPDTEPPVNEAQWVLVLGMAGLSHEVIVNGLKSGTPEFEDIGRRLVKLADEAEPYLPQKLQKVGIELAIPRPGGYANMVSYEVVDGVMKKVERKTR